MSLKKEIYSRNSLKIYLNNYLNLNIYITKFVPQSISLNSDFSSASWPMTALSSGTDDIIFQSVVTIAAPDASFTPAAGTYTNQSVTYNIMNYGYNSVETIN